MQPADDVQLGHADSQSFTRFLRNLLDGELHAVGVALLAGEGAELAAQDAVIGIIDVTVDDETGARAVFPVADQAGESAEGVEVFALKEPQRFLFGKTFARYRL